MPIDFAQPHWLWIGALACAAIALLMAHAERKRRAGLARFAAASPDTTVARTRRWLRNGLALAGAALAFVALARPRAGYTLELTPHQGVDVMFAVDTSKSMRASDIRPDRLTRAKLAVADLVRKLDGDRLGLIAFAGAAFVQSPLTVDRTVFLESLDALDTDVIPVGGTDISSAIRAAEQAMGSEPDHGKVLVLLSDGEDLAGDVVATAKDAAKRGLAIYTVGVGSTSGSLIEMTDASGARELVRDAAGQPVMSHLDEPTLRSIAQVTGGAYQPLGADGRGLDALYAIAKRKLPASSAAGTPRMVYSERFQIPLALALGCLLGELALGDHKRRRAGRGLAAATFAFGLGVFVLPRVAAADAAPAVATYNDATATYRKGDFAGAQQGFEAALHTADVGVQENAYYDLGNSRYRTGQATLAKDRDATIETWKRALEAYDAALALTPADGDARFNRDYVAKKLAALEQQQKKDDEQKPKQDQKEQKQPQAGQQPRKQNQGGQGQQPRKQNQGGQGQPKDQHGQGQGQQDQNGQRPKDQNGQGPQKQDQNGQGQQPQRQDQNGPGRQQPSRSGQGPQKPSQNGQDQGQQPKPADAPDAAVTAPPQAAADKPGEQKPAPADARTQAAATAAATEDAKHRAAGELTRGQAVQLLESVEGDLKPMALHGRASHPTQPTPIKDW